MMGLKGPFMLFLLAGGLRLAFTNYDLIQDQYIVTPNLVFPDRYLLPCTLGNQTISIMSRITCLSRCQADPDCNMVCYNGSVCSFFASIIRPTWIPESYPESLTTMTGLKCYYIPHSDSVTINSKIVSVLFWQPYSTGTEEMKKRPVFDFWCPKTPPFFFHPSAATDQWWQVELDDYYRIAKVIITVYSQEFIDEPKKFTSIEVRVGNSSGNSGTLNVLLDNYQGPPDDQNLDVEFKPGSPVVGKFVWMSKKGMGILFFKQMRIFETI